MPEPEGYEQEIFKAENGFSFGGKWRIQDGLIDAVANKITNADNQEVEDKRGYCFAMTCNWIRLCLQHGGIDKSAEVIQPRQLLFASIVQSGYLGLRLKTPVVGGIGNMIHTGMATAAEADGLVLNQYGLQVRWQKTFEQFFQEFGEAISKPQKAQKRAQHKAKKTGTLAGPMYIGVHVPRHALGLCIKVDQGLWYLFDPNYGLYKYAASKCDGLFAHMDSYIPEDNAFVRFYHLVLAPHQ